MFTNLKNDYFLGLKCLFTIIFIPFITYYNLLTYYYYHNIISSISITTIIFFFTIIIFSIIPYWVRKTLFLLTYIWLLSLCIISRQRLSSNSLPTYIQTHTQTHTYTHTHTYWKMKKLNLEKVNKQLTDIITSNQCTKSYDHMMCGWDNEQFWVSFALLPSIPKS